MSSKKSISPAKTNNRPIKRRNGQTLRSTDISDAINKFSTMGTGLGIQRKMGVRFEDEDADEEEVSIDEDPKDDYSDSEIFPFEHEDPNTVFGALLADKVPPVAQPVQTFANTPETGISIY
mgnify:CR=1 FL=1